MKTNKHKKIVVALLAITMIAMYGFLPPQKNVQAGIDQIKNISDTISDSDRAAANVIHTIQFTIGSTTPEDGFLSVVFPPEFTDVLEANVTCGKNAFQQAILAASSTADSNIVDCVAGAGGLAATTTVITVEGVTNPNPVTDFTSYLFYVYNYYSDNETIQEQATYRVAILEDIKMYARVHAALTFTVFGTSSATYVGDVMCDNDTTATTTDFGVLAPYASTTVCQMLEVTSNATNGFIVTVEQDHELLSDSGDNINSFNNADTGTGSSTTPIGWTPPREVLDQYQTYGHMGLTSDDDLSGVGGYDLYNSGNNVYVGFNDTDPVIVFAHAHPTNGAVRMEGRTSVAYTAEVSALQEAGDYELSLTYICTATY